MAEKTTNKLIPIITIAIVVIVAALFMKNSNDSNVEMRQAEPIDTIDGDSTADTLRTLTAELTALREENKELSTSITTMQEEINQPEPDDGSMSKLEALTDKVDTLFGQQYIPDNQDPVTDVDYDFDMGGMMPPPALDEWIEPANEPVPNSDGTYPTELDLSAVSTPSLDVFGDTSPLNNNVGQMLTAGIEGQEEEIVLDAVYTIPRNSTLMGSTGMTALVGRIPVNGSVEDPYPVKIIIGRDNLTANGLELPDVSHMIFTGTATGDWALSCVRADLTSSTFVFNDGTIRTLSIGDESMSESGGNANRLAWISDERGIPCVSGKRISNAASQLTMAMIAEGIATGAKAVANAETTNSTSTQGDVVSSVTGSALKSAGYETLAGTGGALSSWIKEREQQSFDVIYVNAGSHVAVHIDAELPIDYNPNGRKLNHGFNKQARASRYLD